MVEATGASLVLELLTCVCERTRLHDTTKITRQSKIDLTKEVPMFIS
jgi:hypothetical protein